jgi:hypothetical protein
MTPLVLGSNSRGTLVDAKTAAFLNFFPPNPTWTHHNPIAPWYVFLECKT